MTKQSPLSLKRALETGQLADFAKQEAHRKGSKAKFKRLLGRAVNAPKRQKTGG